MALSEGISLPSPFGRRCHAVTDEGFSGHYVPSDDTLIRPAGTFSPREKAAHFNLVPLGHAQPTLILRLT